MRAIASTREVAGTTIRGLQSITDSTADREMGMLLSVIGKKGIVAAKAIAASNYSSFRCDVST
jgi:hypothetical protein